MQKSNKRRAKRSAAASTLNAPDPDALTWSIKQTARMTNESEWAVKQKLRAGIYKAVKSGRRTLVIPASVREHVAGLPAAEFQPPRA